MLAPVVTVAALTVAACSANSSSSRGASATITSSQQAAPGAVSVAAVRLADLRFTPASLTITAGTTVTWTWDDGDTSHNVAFDSFASPTQSSGTWSHRFDTPGTYLYRCTLHPFMTAEVIVR
jgi:plastocyanin